MKKLEEQVLTMSRQTTIGKLSPWFDKKLKQYISDGTIHTESELLEIGQGIVKDLGEYREQTGTSTAVVGISGGVDSALTSALLKDAGWEVIGVTLPIHQDAEETMRGYEVCQSLDIRHINKDLTLIFDQMLRDLTDIDASLYYQTSKASKIRAGNMRARLRMIALYNLASANKGLVASTDNYSELAMGFWTLHGDVGDLSPIQSLTKSWEVPSLAKMWNIPESVWTAKPTDGLGVDAGDEAQFGFSYLELDLMLIALGHLMSNGFADDQMKSIKMGGINLENVKELLDFDGDLRAAEIFDNLTSRMKGTWFKRMNPVNIVHNKDASRYNRLDWIDRDLFQPPVVKE